MCPGADCASQSYVWLFTFDSEKPESNWIYTFCRNKVIFANPFWAKNGNARHTHSQPSVISTMGMGWRRGCLFTCVVLDGEFRVNYRDFTNDCSGLGGERRSSSLNWPGYRKFRHEKVHEVCVQMLIHANYRIYIEYRYIDKHLHR